MGDPTRLSAIVRHPDGSQTQWTQDEVDVGLVPGAVTLGTSMPGGFRSASARFLRSLQREGTEGPFDEVQFVGPGGEIAWEGRLDQMPRTSEGGGAVTPQAVGHVAILDDSKSFAGIIVDRTTDRWGQIDLARRQALNASFQVADGTTEWHSAAGPCVAPIVAPYAWSTAAGRPYAAVGYDAGPGMSIGRVTAEMHRFGSQSGLSDPDWVFQIFGGDTPDTLANFEGRTDLRLSGDGGDASYTAASPHRYWEAAAYYSGASNSTATGPEFGFRLYDVAMHGPHGLTEYPGAGTYPDGTPIGGYLASDILAWALPQAAPGLRFTLGHAGTIRPSDYPIPHLVFDQLSNGTDVVNAVNGFHQWEWAVWEDRQFYWHPTGERSRVWVMRTGERFVLAPEGDRATNIYTGVVVEFPGVDGRRHTVGPTGTSVEFVDDDLADRNPANPAVANGVQRIAVLSLQTPTTTLGATTLGRAWMIERSRASRAGSATAKGMVVDQDGNPAPPWMVRAGDQLVVADRPQDPARCIIETDYDHATRTVQMTLDNTASRADAVIQRVGASVIGVL